MKKIVSLDIRYSDANIQSMKFEAQPIRPPLMRLAEMQGHRCALCSIPFVYDVYSNHPAFPAMTKVDSTLPRTYDNTIAACRKCASESGSGAYKDIWEYYEMILSGEERKSTFEKRDRLIDQKVIVAIRQCLEDMGHSNLTFPEIFGKAPLEAAPQIARSIIFRDASRVYKTYDQWKERRKSRDAKWMNQGNRRRFMEAQNHRCCYCGHVFNTELSYHPRYATWEHVESMNDGGLSKMHNVVMACLVCNNLREHMKMTAIEYADWAAQNLDEIEIKAQKQLKAIKRKMTQRGSETFYTKSLRKRSLFAQ